MSDPGPLPGFPLGPWAQWGLVAGLAAVVLADRFLLGGILFSGPIWHIILWIVAGLALAVGLRQCCRGAR
jgi:hypothetical protein